MGSTWDRYLYNGRLDSIRRMLADLQAIDTFVADLGGPPYPPYGPVREIGDHYPFELKIRVPDGQRSSPSNGTYSLYSPASLEADLDAYISGVRSVADAAATFVVSEVKESMTNITAPTASQFADAAGRVEQQISANLDAQTNDDFGMLSHSLADWHGAAADQFADYVYNRMQAAINEQKLAAETIRYGLTAAGAIVTLAQDSLMQLVDSIHDILDDQLRQRQKDHESKSPSLTTWLAIGAGALGVIGAIPTGGASIGAAEAVTAVLTATGAAMGAVSAGLQENATGQKQSIEEHDAVQIANRLIDGARTVYNNAAVNWVRLECGIQPYITVVTEAESNRTLFPAQPDIADGVTPETFHHDSVNY